jgi:hypothetical protein
LILRQRLDEVIEAEPKAPAVVIEGHWKQQSHNEEDHQDLLVARTKYAEREEADDQDYKFRCHHIRQDRPYKKTFFTFEERAAILTVMPYLKWAAHY